jgi:hypothetical protein
LEGKFIQVLLSMGFRVVEQDLIVCDVKYLILVIDGVDFLASDTDERLLALASGGMYSCSCPHPPHGTEHGADSTFCPSGGHLLLEPANRPLVKPFGAQMYFFSEGKASTATMVASGVSFTNSRSLPLSALCTDGHDPLVMPLCSRGDDKTMDSFLFHLAHILGCVSPSAIGSPAATVGKTLESLQGPFESPSSTQEYCKTSAANQGLPPFDLHEAIARTLSAEF